MSAAAPLSVRDLITETRIAPSILAADYARFGEQVQEVLGAGARIVHFDIMDGHFVPPISFGSDVVAALTERVHEAGAIADVHLMIEHPDRQVEAFAQAGADVITVHCEATSNLHYVLGAIRQAGCLAGVAINPGTPPDQLAAVADTIDLALCMTVNPGWGGQRFIDSTATKLTRLRELLGDACALEVDGGVDLATGPVCAALGANILVAGSAVFGRATPELAFRELSSAVAEARVAGLSRPV